MVNIYKHVNDIPDEVRVGVEAAGSVAIDTETTGVNYFRDRICLIQMSFSENECHIIQMKKEGYPRFDNIKAILADDSIEKLFHFGRFDIAMLYKTFDVLTQNVYCTKIASKIARTYTERHSLKELCREMLGIEISKQEQSSDWGVDVLRNSQEKYAANDVLYLHMIKRKLDTMLMREKRMDLAQCCFKFLPYRAKLDARGWLNDIFEL